MRDGFPIIRSRAYPVERRHEARAEGDDNDWNVYKDIQKNNFSEDEEDDQQLLNDIEEKLTELDSDFNMILYQVGPTGHQRPV